MSNKSVEEVVTLAMREADQEFERVGGSTRHHVRDCLLPALERHGVALYFVDDRDAGDDALRPLALALVRALDVLATHGPNIAQSERDQVRELLRVDPVSLRPHDTPFDEDSELRNGLDEEIPATFMEDGPLLARAAFYIESQRAENARLREALDALYETRIECAEIVNGVCIIRLSPGAWDEHVAACNIARTALRAGGAAS